jgi:hypothetical protein
MLVYHLRQYVTDDYQFSDFLSNREETVLYQVDSREFRGDPYVGALAALDYLMCRNGRTYEDREKNLGLVLGKVRIDGDSFEVESSNGCELKTSWKRPARYLVETPEDAFWIRQDTGI